MPERLAGAEHWERHELFKELDNILAEQHVVVAEIKRAISGARTEEEARREVFDGGLAPKFDKLHQEFMECLRKLAGHQEEKSK